MRENDFEKHVQQKLDELQLRPSKEVWEGVEDVLRKEKKCRRIIIFWWLLPLLLVGSGSVYFLNRPSLTKQPLTQAGKQNNDNTNHPSADNSIKSISPSETNSSDKISVPVNDNGSSSDKTTSAIKQRERKTLDISDYQEGKEQSTARIFPKKKTTEKVYTSKELIENNQPLITSDETTVVTQFVEKNTESPVTAEVTDTVIARLDIKSDSITEPSVTESKKKKNKSKWVLGIAVKPAIANTHKGKIFESSTDALFAPPSFINNSGANPINNSVSPVAINILEPPVPALSGNIEVFVRKQLSKRFHLQTGVQYSLLRSRSLVGSNYTASRTIQNQITPNANVSSFYGAPISNIQTQKYMNNYHLLGITGTLSWELIQKRKFRLSWDNGIAANRLLATNALHYDGVLRGYYQDFAPYRKTQIFVTSGFTIPYYTGKKYTLSVSPFASYGLTSLLKSKQVEGARLYQFGVSMNLLFNGK